MNPVPPHLADRFRDCFSPGVITVDPRTKKVSVDERGVRGETMSREVLRHPDLAKFVKLARVRDHFICAFLNSYVGRGDEHPDAPVLQSTSSQRGRMNRSGFRSKLFGS